MKLWSIQNSDVWDILKIEGRYSCPRGFSIPEVDPDFYPIFGSAYEWMRKQAMRRIGSPVYRNDNLLWAWYQWNGIKHPKPDLRYKYYCAQGTWCVLLELEIPDAKVLLSDFCRWNSVLNRLHLTKNKNEFDTEDEYNALRTLKSIEYRKKRSWNHIFDIHKGQYDESWHGEVEKAIIQAVFWEIKLNQVKSVRHFTAR